MKQTIIVLIILICMASFVLADLSSTIPQISLSKSGEITRNSSSCSITSSNGDWANYNCSIPIYFYDGAGAWSINASIKEPPCTRTLNNGNNLTFAIVNSTAGEVICLNSGTYILPTITTPLSCNYLVNNSAVAIPGLTLNKGAISQTSIYHYVNIPPTPQGIYASISNWIYTCS